MSKIADWIQRTFNPSGYYAAKAAELAAPAPPRSSANMIDQAGLLPFNPLFPMEAKSVTLGDVLPRSVLNKAVAPTFDPNTAIKQGLDRSTWAYACITILADSAAQVYYRADVWDPVAEKWNPEPNSELQKLLDTPNEWMTTRDVMKRAVYHLYLSGNGLITKIRSVDGRILEIWPHNPTYTRPVLSAQDWIAEYEIKVPGATRRTVAAKDMIHFQIIDPDNAYWGRSPIKTLMDTLETDNKARDWNKTAMDNRAVTDGAFSVEKPLTDAQYNVLKAQIREQHQGAANAREPWLISGGAKWEAMSLSPVEMDFINSRHFTREEICAVFRIPPPMIGIYDRATLNNAWTGRLSFWEDTMMPLVQDLAEKLTLSLAADFGRRDGRRWRVWADATDVAALQDAYAARLGLAERLVALGFPVDVAAERFELGTPEGVAGAPAQAPPSAAQEPAQGPPSEAVGNPTDTTA